MRTSGPFSWPQKQANLGGIEGQMDMNEREAISFLYKLSLRQEERIIELEKEVGRLEDRDDR